MAADLPANQRRIQVQGARYEGYTVWFNSLLESAGGSILKENGDVSLATAPTRKALQVMHDLATSDSADPSMSNNQEDQARHRVPVRAARRSWSTTPTSSRRSGKKRRTSTRRRSSPCSPASSPVSPRT